ncbi:MAG: M23 family metallopeptidase [Planctomycetota bacterium]|nr:M23 family metallopeptidase [Planctomycetota bacterium]
MLGSKWVSGVVLAAALTAAAAEGPAPATPAPKAWTFAGDRDYETRVKESPRNKPLNAASLVLPHPAARNILPDPVVVEAGQYAVDYPDRDRIVWAVVPAGEATAAYLEKRKELLAQNKAADLVAWCEQNKLPACAEFELRCQLAGFQSFMAPGYRPLLARWLKLADARQADYSFPLPLAGEWTVMPDRTGHHRLKAGAAYAFDMMIVKDGRYFKGTGAALDDYYAWGQPILAQADGVVVQVIDTNPDEPPGRVGPFSGANWIEVDYGGGILGGYGHCQKGSAKVKPGDRVKAGETLALVGNSGASGYPHLHFTMLDPQNNSIRGRFRCEVRNGAGWKPIDGEDLRTETVVRNSQPAAGR